jgi:hypothetical protein
MTGYDELDDVLDTAMSGILAKLDATFDADAGLADIRARSTMSGPYPARARPGRHGTGSSRLEEVCGQIDLVTAWLDDLIRWGEHEAFGGSSFLELARDNLVQLRAGLASRTTARPEAQQLTSDIQHQLAQADQILRSQHATTLDRLASNHSLGEGSLTDQVRVMREMVIRLYEPDGRDLSLMPTR